MVLHVVFVCWQYVCLASERVLHAWEHSCADGWFQMAAGSLAGFVASLKTCLVEAEDMLFEAAGAAETGVIISSVMMVLHIAEPCAGGQDTTCVQNLIPATAMDCVISDELHVGGGLMGDPCVLQTATAAAMLRNSRSGGVRAERGKLVGYGGTQLREMPGGTASWRSAILFHKSSWVTVHEKGHDFFAKLSMLHAVRLNQWIVPGSQGRASA